MYDEIKNKDEHIKAVMALGNLIDAKPNTPKYEKLQKLIELIKKYESTHTGGEYK